ncbi:IS110 family transposase [Bradyrhizobium paxllaeri]|uniref:IS110 family transposase n=1 Tax=Bradyrhizobium paxllaeri TaxID=190148 RepID=UPI0011DF805D|nr:IS110 family transposase [Bradyrhizobium paxllaeri]
MQASTVAAPTAGHIGTIFVAIELSQRSWRVALHSPDKDKISHHKLEGGDHAELLALVGRVRERAARTLGGVPAVASCYEAGYDGFWLHRLLLAAGITNYVFDPASIAVDQRARRVKTDRIDGERMLRTLMAYLRGEPRVVRIVRVPAAEQEDARRGSRERDRLIKEQTAHTNRIKALLRLRGMAVGNPRRRDWLSWLAAQRDWQGQAVPPRMLSEIRHEHARLMLVRDRLDALAQEAAAAEPMPAEAEMTRRSELLRRLKCLGPAFATTLTSEVFYKDFRNRREVGSYFGLTPSPWQSGGIDRDQGISKAGNPRARCAAIELAWLWLRHQPDSKLTLEYRKRTLDAGKRIKRVAIVALARKLMVALWRYLTTGLVPEGAVLKAVKI